MMDYTHLAALRAIIQTGSFDAAAASLNVTPSAISQRIKTLEDHLGTVLIIRSSPATATPAGQRLFRHTEEVALLETTLGSDLNGLLPNDAATPIRVVVNADSLDTWFIHAMSRVDGFLFDISTDDEDVSADWLRRGEVMAAVTAHAKPVQGCDSIPLGSLRYLATASPDLATQYFADGFTATAAKSARMLVFNRKDHLQYQWLSAQFGKRITPPAHLLPSTHGFVTAAIAGLGWGLNPEVLVRDHIAAGRLVTIGDTPIYDVPLFWQFMRVMGHALQPLTKAVKSAARQWLVQ
ncbi:MAG: LysR family transcriptional regulator ArgP [Marinosulfonomonas sp.]|nr:LysR family transcriptional regulator ArgP [Marinosulfonomonas sp.]